MTSDNELPNFIELQRVRKLSKLFYRYRTPNATTTVRSFMYQSQLSDKSLNLAKELVAIEEELYSHKVWQRKDTWLYLYK